VNKKNKKTKKEYVMIDRLNDCLLGREFTVISEDLPPKETYFTVTVVSEEGEK
jgi:hypothetical protein